MNMIVRAITPELKIMAISAREMVERAREIHGTTPLATAALGRTLCGVSMLGRMLKEEKGSVTLQINGGGPLGAIVTVSDSSGNARGYLQNPACDLPLKSAGKLDVGRGVGTDGLLTVIKDMGMREPFNGHVKLVSGEIAEDLTAYFSESEQVPSACALGVLVDTDMTVKAAGGYIVQALPGASDATLAAVAKTISEAGPVTGMLDRGMSPGDIVTHICGTQAQIIESVEVEYRCACSMERVERALISIGEEELRRIIAEQGKSEVTCQFCDKLYNFTSEALEKLAAEARK